MTLSELMSGKTPDIAFSGVSTADDMVLAMGFGGSLEAPDDYLVAQKQIAGHEGSLNNQTSSLQFIRTGQVETKTGTQRTIAVSGERFFGDAFQDRICDHDVVFGTGSAVVFPYVYFNLLTGEGEKGSATVTFSNDHSGQAGSPDGFSITLTSDGVPEKYTYTAGGGGTNP